jgi:hypothetical protein
MSPYLKNTHHKKRVGGVAQGVGPEFKPQYWKKKKKEKKKHVTASDVITEASIESHFDS